MRIFLIILLLACCLPGASGQTASFLPHADVAEQSGGNGHNPESTPAEVDSPAAKGTRPVIDLEHLRVLELSDQEGLDWRRDWWKYLMMVLAGALCILLLVHITNLILRVIGVFICIGGGILGAIIVAPMLTGWLPELIPDKISALVSPDVICLLLGTLCGYALAALVLAILRKPAHKDQKNA